MSCFAEQLRSRVDIGFLGLGTIKVLLIAKTRLLGRLDHKDGKLILDRRVVGLFNICAVHFQRLLRAKERGVVPNRVAKVGVVDVRRSRGRLRIGDIEQIDV